MVDPQIETLGYSFRRYYVDAFYTRQAAALPAGARVLDIGGTKLRKRGQFDIERFPVRTVYANLVTTKRPDVQSTAEQLPFAEASFDVALCAELLEHVPEPRTVLREAYRVLRPGGRLLACTPFLFRVHADPHDYGRYTDYYWRTTLAQLGFQQIEVEAQGGFFAVLADFVKFYAYKFGGQPGATRLRQWALRQLIAWLWRQEAARAPQADPLLSSYTTGFGVSAIR